MTESYDKGCVNYLKALSDPSRWDIMGLLSDSREALCLGEVAEALGLSTYNASRHVRILVEADLVTVVRDGRFKKISIAPEWRGKNWKEPQQVGTLDLGCCRFDFSKSARST